MITGYNTRSQVKHQFNNSLEMARFMEIPQGEILLGFQKDRIFRWNNYIFYWEDEKGNPHKEDPQFEEGFGYPKDTGKQLEMDFDNVPTTQKMMTATISVPEGSMVVTPNDKNYDEVCAYFDARNRRIEEMVEQRDRENMKAILEKIPTKEKINTKAAAGVSPKNALGGKDGGSYSSNGSSAHYKRAILEYVDKQERCYGTFLAYALCFMQVDKYRDRAGKKDGVPADKDLVKANWYDTATQYLKEKIDLYNNKLGKDYHAYANFEAKYGLGRSEYITMPLSLTSCLAGELNIEFDYDLKGLGQIVDELQNQ